MKHEVQRQEAALEVNDFIEPKRLRFALEANEFIQDHGAKAWRVQNGRSARDLPCQTAR